MKRATRALSVVLTSLAVVMDARAAQLPSRKKVDAVAVGPCVDYGPGFFFIPDLTTCVKLGGSVRAELQYAPARDIYEVSTGAVRTDYTSVYSSSSGTTTLYAPRNFQDETGFDMRGRISFDSRTATDLGDARMFVRLRAASSSGLSNTAIANSYAYSAVGDLATVAAIEAAMVQVANFTFGIAPENYAMMPSFFYHATPWTTFVNGVKQISYTQLLDYGFSATLAMEDRRDHFYGGNVAQASLNGSNFVGNLRLDRPFGFVAAHMLVGFNSNYVKSTGAAPTSYASGFTALGTSSAVESKTHGAFALGLTGNVKLPTGEGDQFWFTTNYANGALGALLSDGGLSNIGTLGTHRLLGGVVRLDANLVPTANSSAASASVESVSGHTFAGAVLHHWSREWRAHINAGYIEMNPPKQIQTAQTAWGRGRLYVLTLGLIYSPLPQFDIGLEVQAARIHNQLQNPTTAFQAAGMPGLMDQNISTKLRAERSF